MTVRFLRGAPTMAYPEGRLLAVRGSEVYLLAADGWVVLGTAPMSSAEPLSAAAAREWCAKEGWDETLLTTLPHRD